MMRSVLLFGVLVAGCIGPHAFAEMEGRDGHEVYGTLKIDETGDGVHIHGNIRGLPPGEHGLHIFADKCGREHQNPHGKRHGGLRDAESHAGDLGNIVVDADGEVDIDITTGKIEYKHGDGALDHWIGVSFFRDDLTTDPDGNSGSAIACGRIEVPSE